MLHHSDIVLTGVVLLLLVPSLSAAPEPESATDESATDAAAEKKPTLLPAKCGSTKNVHRFGKVYLAGQPRREDLQVAKQAGIKTIINLRLQNELDWDEAAAAKAAGLAYHHVPFRDPQSLTDEVFTKTRKLLGDKKKQPLMLHCGSANRVGAIWLVHRVLDDGVDVDQATIEAKKVGLRMPRYLEKAKDYIERIKAQAKKERANKKDADTG